MPISPILAPPLPIRIPFWDSVSAQISARTVTRPSSRGLDLDDRDLDRVRDLLAGAVQHLLADQLGQQQLARLVAAVLRRVHVGALGHQLAEPLDQRRQALAGAGADREDLVDPLQLGRRGEHRRPARSGRAGRHLLTAQITGSSAPAPSRARAMKRSPGPDPLLAVDDEQGDVGVGQLALDPAAASARSGRRAGAARPGRSTRTSWRPASRSVATPRIARRVVCGRTETIATWEPTSALTSVDLPTLGRPASPTKPARVIAAPPAPRPAAPASRRRRSRGRGRRGGGRRGRRPR